MKILLEGVFPISCDLRVRFSRFTKELFHFRAANLCFVYSTAFIASDLVYALLLHKPQNIFQYIYIYIQIFLSTFKKPNKRYVTKKSSDILKVSLNQTHPTSLSESENVT